MAAEHSRAGAPIGSPLTAGRRPRPGHRRPGSASPPRCAPQHPIGPLAAPRAAAPIGPLPAPRAAAADRPPRTAYRRHQVPLVLR